MKRSARLLATAALGLGIAPFPSVLHAACSSPTGAAGEMYFNGSTYRMCDGSAWYDMGLAAGLDGISDVDISSSAPVAGSGLIFDGADWVPTTAPGTVPMRFTSAGIAIDVDGDNDWAGVSELNGGLALSGKYDAASNPNIFISDTGRVGVGNASPDDTLDVGGGIQATNVWGLRTVQFRNSELSHYNGNCDDSGFSSDQTGQGLVWYDRDNGGSPSLFMCGQGSAWELSASSPSSRRYKEDIRPFDVDADKLSELKPVSFEWKDKAGWEDRRDVGLIAEEVDEVFPELVIRKNGKVHGLRYDRLPVHLLAGYQELDERAEAVETDVRQHERRIESLRERVETLAEANRRLRRELDGAR